MRVDAESLVGLWDEAAEMALVGACLLGGKEVVPLLLEKVGTTVVFYDLRHEGILRCCQRLYLSGKPIDLVTVVDDLRTRQELDQSGGIEYLQSLEDVVPSWGNWQAHLEVVWTKFLGRQIVATGAAMQAEVSQWGGVTEATFGVIDARVDELKVLSTRLIKTTPHFLKKPWLFAEEYGQMWFNRNADTYGVELPFSFPMRWRPNESTVIYADSGSGKSTLILQACVWAMTKGALVCVASMEVPVAMTLWMMARQLLGVGNLPPNSYGETEALKALKWLDSRMMAYDFLGITSWVQLLDTFKGYHAQLQAEFEGRKEAMPLVLCVVDSVMRLGIADTDLDQQSMAAKAFSEFSVKSGVHVILIMHARKGSEGGKNDAAGSKSWTNNANNVVKVEVNARKEAQRVEWKEEWAAGAISKQEYQARLDEAEFRMQWDSKFVLQKQRWPGLPQNGSKRLWFDKESLRVLDKPDGRAGSWI